MTIQDYTGKNLEELLKSVAAEKGVSVEDLTYTIKEEKAGFLGIGGKIEAEIYCSKDIESFLKNYLKTFFTNIEMSAEVVVENDEGFYRINVDMTSTFALTIWVVLFLGLLELIIRLIRRQLEKYHVS